MRASIATTLVSMVALIAGKVLDLKPSFNRFDSSLDEFRFVFRRAQGTTAWDPPPPAANDLWNKCVCRGTKLLTGMRLSDYEAGQQYDPPQVSAQSEFRDFPRMLP